MNIHPAIEQALAPFAPPERIANPGIEELCQALTRGMPTVEEIRSAMLLAYKTGNIDGHLEAAEEYAEMLKASA